ncbi:MAG: helix-turn-helix domain-containing protein, partial [Pyrinomonadaceae bacterium]
LERTGWHRGKTAKLLGISPSTLYRRLKEYNLER